MSWLQRSKDQGGKDQLKQTATHNVGTVGAFLKSGKTAEEFIKSYENANSHNNVLKALKHYADYLGVPRPNVKQKPKTLYRLIIAPRPEEIKEIVQRLQSLDIKAYMALCATSGLRCEKLHFMKWSQIDFENGWLNINENVKTKRYRPNCLHKDVAVLLQQLREKQPKDQERVFTFGYKIIARIL